MSCSSKLTSSEFHLSISILYRNFEEGIGRDGRPKDVVSAD